MKKLSIYYVMSIVTLAFMLLLMGWRLQITGWFEDHHGRSPAERIRQEINGKYELKTSQGLTRSDTLVGIYLNSDGRGADWLTLSMDTIPRLYVRVSDFEDSQVLLELYLLDSLGHEGRLEGCELLLMEDEPEHFTGNTIGELCGFKEGSMEYLAMGLLLDGSIVSLQIERRGLEDHSVLETKKYLLERIDSQ